jgi:transcriptional regulator with XRE-family HTH domain
MFRKRSGLSQPELARLLGCKEGSKVSRYERGERSPSFDTLLAYEIVFRETTQKLFAGASHHARAKIKKRAQALFRELDAKEPFTAAVKQKMAFLTDLIYPPDATRP